MKKRRIPVIVGPTAVGKTAVSIAIAQKLDGEIISADSRQIFTHMTIATAKPLPEDLESVRHHFIDIIDPDESYSAGQFGTDGRSAIEEIAGRGKEVLVVGGSGLYIRSLIDGLFGEPARDEDLRKRIHDDMEKFGIERMYDQLRSIDPVTASKVHPNDARRITRALEVYELTGKRMSDLHESKEADFDFEPVMIGLTCERDQLYRRIDARVDAMIARGVIEETRGLLEKGYSPKLVSMESLGYREIAQYLNHEISYEEMITIFKKGSRNYAKRQLTWFRKDPRIKWLEVSDWENVEKTANEIIAGIQIKDAPRGA